MFKKNKIVNSALFLLAVLLFTSCRDFIEKDITEEVPQIILPANNDTIPSNPVYFKWEELDGATKYRIEVVSPSFSNIQAYYVDSIVYGTNFHIDLDSNVFEMRVTGLNAGYESKHSAVRKFWLGSSQISSGTTVLLDSLDNNQYVNENFNGVFSWFILNGASSYTFELHNTASFSGQTLEYIDQIGATNISSGNTVNLPEGTYSWGVKAFLSNDTETIYSKRIFYVDTINPTLASLSSPSNNAYVSAGSINFNWALPSNVGQVQSPLISFLEISTNAAFTSTLPPVLVQDNNANVDLVSGTYYWRVRMKDLAGNVGPVPSSYRLLNVQP